MKFENQKIANQSTFFADTSFLGDAFFAGTRLTGSFDPPETWESFAVPPGDFSAVFKREETTFSPAKVNTEVDELGDLALVKA